MISLVCSIALKIILVCSIALNTGAVKVGLSRRSRRDFISQYSSTRTNSFNSRSE